MTTDQPAAFARFGDVAVRLSVELGRTEMPLREVLMLGEGSTVTLDRLTDELLDVTANGRVIARGEVVAERGRFALRIVTLVGEDGRDMTPQPGRDERAAAAGGLGDVATSPDLGSPIDPPAEPAPSSAPPPPVDPLTSALDDLL